MPPNEYTALINNRYESTYTTFDNYNDRQHTVHINKDITEYESVFSLNDEFRNALAAYWQQSMSKTKSRCSKIVSQRWIYPTILRGKLHDFPQNHVAQVYVPPGWNSTNDNDEKRDCAQALNELDRSNLIFSIYLQELFHCVVGELFIQSKLMFHVSQNRKNSNNQRNQFLHACEGNGRVNEAHQYHLLVSTKMKDKEKVALDYS
uniref:Uncharacterized protein n=1 Tax=Glossina austeni TaxID=7395 RepID=A0A1A9VQY1_GLOAU